MNRQTLKEELRKTYKYRIEIHAHTCPSSLCSEISADRMAEIYAELGYDAIVLTNHFKHIGDDKKAYIDQFFQDYETAKEKGKTLGLGVQIAAEIRFAENHNDYLLYGVDRDMLSDIYDLLPYGVENFRKNYKLDRSVFLQAHPFRDGMTEVDPKLLDGIEIFNMHPGHNSRIGIASTYARENGFSLVTAGSDFHHPNKGHEGTAALLSKTLPQSSFEVADILKSGDYLLETGKNNIIIP